MAGGFDMDGIPRTSLPAGVGRILAVAAMLAAMVVPLTFAGCGGSDVPGNYRGGELPEGVEAGDGEASMQGNRLVGSVWKLVAIDPPRDQIMFVDDPDRYLLQFKDEEIVAVKADCNSCEGRYSSSGRALVLRVDCVTQNCRPGSFGERYLAAIDLATTFNMAGNGKELFVNFGAERGVLTFKRF
jgi:hypothetical protein